MDLEELKLLTFWTATLASNTHAGRMVWSFTPNGNTLATGGNAAYDSQNIRCVGR
jgi:hypothetical protein